MNKSKPAPRQSPSPHTTGGEKNNKCLQLLISTGKTTHKRPKTSKKSRTRTKEKCGGRLGPDAEREEPSRGAELFGFLQSQIALGLTPFTSAAAGKQYRIDRVAFLKSTFLLCAYHTSSEPLLRLTKCSENENWHPAVPRRPLRLPSDAVPQKTPAPANRVFIIIVVHI